MRENRTGFIMMRTRESNGRKKQEGKGGPRVLGRSRALPPGFHPGGFTLIELLVVMMIMTVVIAMTIPRVGSNWKQIQDSDFLQQFTETLERSRLYAMNSGLPVSFRLNGTNRVYGVESPPAHPIPLNVEIRANRLEQDPGTGDFIITFYPDGSLVGDDVDVIFDNTRTYGVHIDPLFGTVRVERGGEAGG
ncbi:MAG: type II secretion system protein [Syntrophobacteraceae bacterium]|nr:type II secretion system protein [Syntrophobacteraceae bacterium]